jgi:hypothetical protein
MHILHGTPWAENPSWIGDMIGSGADVCPMCLHPLIGHQIACLYFEFDILSLTPCNADAADQMSRQPCFLRQVH